MKKINLLILFCIMHYLSHAQPGTGMENTGPFFGHYSKLSTPGNIANWERAIGVYQNQIAPRSYLEINTNTSHLPNPLGSIANTGEVFSTYSSVDPKWRMFWTSIGNVDLQVASLYSTLNGSDFNIEASRNSSGSMIFRTATASGPAIERMRIIGNHTPREGYIGLNNAGPTFHMDMITPAFIGNELFYSGRPSDVVGSRVGFFNATVITGEFIPTSFGYVDATQQGPGYETIGSIDPSQDIAVNNNSWAITRFVSGKGMVTNLPFQCCPPATPISSASVRNLFSWSNSDIVDMVMNVDGRVRIMNNMAPPNTAPVPPGNRLEVTCSPGDPYYAPIPPNGASGLRLTLMTTTSNPVPNPGTGVLSVDKNGDVVYVQTSTVTSGGCCIGNPCKLPIAGTNPLPTNWEVPLNNKNYVFSGNNGGTTVNNVGIGTNCTPLAKLHVDQSTGTNLGSMGIFVENHDLNTCGNGPVIGIKSLVSNPNPVNDLKVAGWFEATPSPNCFGSLRNYAIVVPQNGGMVQFGYNPINNTNLGTYILDVNGDVQINGSTAPSSSTGPNCGSCSFALNINGNAVTNAGAWYLTSDKRYKKDIKKFEDATEKLKKISGYTYKYNSEMFKGKTSWNDDTQIGVIAQELKEVLPELVAQDKDGYLAVNYQGIVPVLIEGFKEQQAQIEEQKKINDDQQKQIDELKNMIKSLTTGSSDTKQNNSQSVDLSDKNAIVLDQNVPNPFAESTVITYNIPNDFAKAQIMFSTSDGKIIKSVDVTTKGKGQLNVFANDLSSGMYTYTLVVDGKTIDTKKMVKN